MPQPQATPATPSQTPAQPQPFSESTFLTDDDAARFVSAGMEKDQAALIVQSINRNIATGIPRSVAINAYASPPGKVQQGLGALVTGILQGRALPGSTSSPPGGPGLWPGLYSAPASSVAPDLPAPVSTALGVGGVGLANLAKYAGTLKFLARVAGVASALGRVVSSVLDRRCRCCFGRRKGLRQRRTPRGTGHNHDRRCAGPHQVSR